MFDPTIFMMLVHWYMYKDKFHLITQKTDQIYNIFVFQFLRSLLRSLFRKKPLSVVRRYWCITRSINVVQVRFLFSLGRPSPSSQNIILSQNLNASAPSTKHFDFWQPPQRTSTCHRHHLSTSQEGFSSSNKHHHTHTLHRSDFYHFAEDQRPSQRARSPKVWESADWLCW